MRDPPPSDEWVEAELERQLLDVDVSGESSNESEDASRSSFAIKSYEIPEVHWERCGVSGRFRELGATTYDSTVLAQSWKMEA